jgi:acyl-CoA dehydrogenase
MPALYILAFVVISGALAFLQAPAAAWLAGLALWVAIGLIAGIATPLVAAILAVVFVLPALLLAIKPLRAALVSARVLAIFRKILPQMSSTERDAIEAGTVWWDAELFSGRPRWNSLLEHGAPALTDE